MGLLPDDGLGRAPPLEGVHALAALHADVLVDAGGIEYQPVELGLLLVHDECAVRALGDAEAALEALGRIDAVFHYLLLPCGLRPAPRSLRPATSTSRCVPLPPAAGSGGRTSRYGSG